MGGTITNWAGNVRFAAEGLLRPSTVEELRGVVARASRLRPLGTAHSFNHLADTDGDLVTVAGLPPTVEIDSQRAVARVAAGLRYGEVATHLQAAGFALANLGSLPHISVAGACATGTHGSGDGNGALATSVVAVELVTAAGDIVHLDGDALAGAVVGLGALGVVTAVTLRLEPTFEISQYVYDDLPLDRLDVDAVFGAGYSVSLFTDWSGPRINQVWVKRRADEPEPPSEWLGATRADGPRHPVPGVDPVHCTQQLGRPGPWHTRLPHFRLEFTPSNGEELQAEYLIPRTAALDAVRAISSLRDRLAPVLLISELRTVAADELWLSPSCGRDSIAVHFTWRQDGPAVAALLPVIEDLLAPFAPRPHWGKLFSVAPDVLRTRYEHYQDFAALMHEYDPRGVFRNAMLDAYFPRGG